MTYVTEQQLTDRYGLQMLLDLTDRATPPAGLVDSSVVNRALADTDAAINGFLANKYLLPLTSTPALLTDLAGAIAIYKLHSRIAEEKFRKDYEDALKMLAQIASGVIVLDVTTVGPPVENRNGTIGVSIGGDTGTPRFTVGQDDFGSSSSFCG